MQRKEVMSASKQRSSHSSGTVWKCCSREPPASNKCVSLSRLFLFISNLLANPSSPNATSVSRWIQQRANGTSVQTDAPMLLLTHSMLDAKTICMMKKINSKYLESTESAQNKILNGPKDLFSICPMKLIKLKNNKNILMRIKKVKLEDKFAQNGINFQSDCCVRSAR